MDEGLPEQLPFLPSRIISHEHGILVTGMDGELAVLDEHFNLKSPVNKPFPMSISHAVIVDNRLYATWIDGELMMARMGCIPLDQPIQQGPERAALRTSTTILDAKHPAGSTWSHVLDAEPLGLTAVEGILVFTLWNKGTYGLDLSANEIWRMPPPNWQYERKRPRMNEVIGLSINDGECFVTSKGGRFQKLNVITGECLEETMHEQPEAPLEQVFHHQQHTLICSTNGEVAWVHNGDLKRKLKLNGPVQSATWDGFIHGWRIAGWREELLLTDDVVSRQSWNEIPIHVHPVEGGSIVLFNDGTWANSPHEHPPIRLNEEE